MLLLLGCGMYLPCYIDIIPHLFCQDILFIPICHYIPWTLHISSTILVMQVRMDSQTKARMTEICAHLGMTTSTAFNIFANAFVRANGILFAVKLNALSPTVTSSQMLADAFL